MAYINIKSGEILYEIKSFYRTFEFLKDKVEQRNNLMTQKYFDNAKYLELDSYYPSYVVNSCFLAELELKFLLAITGVEFKSGNKGHDLSYLFNLMADTNKNELKQHYQNLLALYNKTSNYNEDLIKQLMAHSSYSYRDFRYMWERTSHRYENYFMDMFVTVTYKYIIEKFGSMFYI